MALEGFGSRLKAIRQERGYTQKQLAQQLGVTEQAVSKYERGTSYPDVGVLNGMAEVLDCSLDYLFLHEPGKRYLVGQDSVERKAEINLYLLPDIITLQFGKDVIPLFVEEIKLDYAHMISLRQQFASQWGVIIPVIRLKDHTLLEAREYEICINGVSIYKDEANLESPDCMEAMLGKLKELVFLNIEKVLNNQSVYFMVENLREKYPYAVKNIVPEVISYTKLRQVLICLMKEYGCTVSPLLLIIESMENHGEITDIKELAGKVAEDMGPGYRFENWVG